MQIYIFIKQIKKQSLRDLFHLSMNIFLHIFMYFYTFRISINAEL